ncbi:HAAS signaling domain-containing protein [Streptomyces sp. NPDC090025]|uniref:HAAS signaling domain-containing protein n=1 Tax=Streptomyces sp. NPDC090025 TaxID=3365922 RepID=UPI0038372048
MNAIDHPVVSAYLDAVARETAGLPADRRAELLADLREHIEVSGADTEARLREVLAELGEPRTVAASALAEEPYPAAATVAPVSKGKARLTAVLLGFGGLLFLMNPLLGAVALIAGLVLLWSAPHWEQRDKTIATVTSLAVPVAVLIGGLVLSAGRIGVIELLLAMAFALVVPGCGALMLMSRLRAPRASV